MARTHGRLYGSIWNDEDFLDLTGDAQRMYMMLLSLPNVSHCGLLALTVKRWARKAKDWTVERAETALAELDATEYIVIDEDTEELLIRSLMRRDEVYKQPNVLASAATDAEGIASPKLRSALLEEVIRIGRIEGLSERVRTILSTLAGTLRPTLTPTPPEGSTDDHGQATGMGNVTEVGTDSPSTFPVPLSPVPALRAEPSDDPTSALLREHVAAYSQPPPPSAVTPIRREIMRLVAEHVEPDRIRDGLARLRERRLAASLLPQLVTETTPTRRASTTDARVAAGLDLAARYEEAGQ